MRDSLVIHHVHGEAKRRGLDKKKNTKVGRDIKQNKKTKKNNMVFRQYLLKLHD